MRDQGLGSWIERRARIAPHYPAIVAGETSRSYGELARRVRRLAHGLRSLGVSRGDRVGWLGTNHPAFLEALFASAKLGAVLSPINHRLDADAVNRILENARPVVVITAGLKAKPPFPSTIRAHVAVGRTTENAVDYERLIDRSPDEPIDEPVGLQDLCLLPYTSGTTGLPKGVMLTHGNITWNVVNMLASADFGSDDITIALAPFFRVGGTGVNVLPVLFKGGTVVVPESPDPEEILRLIEQHKVTVGFGNPDLLEALAHSQRWLKSDLSSIRFVITGGAPVPERLIRLYLKRRVKLLQGYGLSEAAPVVLLLDPESALRKVGSAGKPVVLDDIRLVNPDGSVCGPGETGELLVSGPNVMAGYWEQPEATQAAIDEAGWLHTRDAARMDEDGNVWIIDRVQDRFISAGHVVYPSDIERVLLNHPGVAEVGIVGASGIRDGEPTAVAFVVRSPKISASAESLLEFCRQRLADHQVPRSIRFLERLPRSSVGKLLRAELKGLTEGSTGQVRPNFGGP